MTNEEMEAEIKELRKIVRILERVDGDLMLEIILLQRDVEELKEKADRLRLSIPPAGYWAE